MGNREWGVGRRGDKGTRGQRDRETERQRDGEKRGQRDVEIGEIIVPTPDSRLPT